MKKIVFLAKTNLNTDGRILNQLELLSENFDNELKIDFVLLPDKEVDDSVLSSKWNLQTIKCFTRGNKFLRPFVVIEFTIRALLRVCKLKPDILHVQDANVIFPVFLFSIFTPKCILIYDDHELPNENIGFFEKLIVKCENYILKKADFVFFANEERMNLLAEKLNLDINKIDFFTNLPISNISDKQAFFQEKYKSQILELEDCKSKNIRLIMHQGALTVDRGCDLLAEFVKKLDKNKNKIVILGANFERFSNFIKQYNLDEGAFLFIGSVFYESLDMFWGYCDVSIIMYKPTYSNNRLCAPNRFYLSIEFGIPVLINKSNPTLLKLQQKYVSGYCIEDIIENNVALEEVVHHKLKEGLISDLRSEEKTRFLHNYSSFIYEKV